MTKSRVYEIIESIRDVRDKSCADIMEKFGEQLEELSDEELEVFEILFYEDDSIFLDATQEQRELLEIIMECLDRLEFD